VRAWVYPVICLLVPQLWAVVVVRVLAAWTRRRELAARRRSGAPPSDFTI